MTLIVGIMELTPLDCRPGPCISSAFAHLRWGPSANFIIRLRLTCLARGHCPTAQSQCRSPHFHVGSPRAAPIEASRSECIRNPAIRRTHLDICQMKCTGPPLRAVAKLRHGFSWNKESELGPLRPFGRPDRRSTWLHHSSTRQMHRWRGQFSRRGWNKITPLQLGGHCHIVHPNSPCQAQPLSSPRIVWRQCTP